MSMTIGRCSITEDPDAGTLRQRGDEVSFVSVINASSVDEMKARVQQLRGLMDNDDETVFPFTWSEDSSFDGFYTDFNVEVSDYATMLTNGACPFTISMRRLGNGFARPLFETDVRTLKRTNAHAVTTPTGTVAAVVNATLYNSDFDTDTAGIGGLSSLLTTEDGSIAVATSAAPIGPARYTSFIAPASYYSSTCKIEVLYGGTWYSVTGQQIPQATGGNWRLSNGICRVYPSAVSGNGRFKVEIYNGGWVAGREFTVGHYDAGGGVWVSDYATCDSAGTLLTPTVLANRPEFAAVQIKTRSSITGTDGLVTYTFSIRQGDTWIELARAQRATIFKMGVATSAVTASTSASNSLHETAASATGRYLFACAQANTTDAVNGRLYQTTATASAEFAIFPDYAAIGATPLTVAGSRDKYLSARSESRRVVVR